MKTLTWADFAKHEPCYNPAEKYGEWQGTILDLMQHPNIPALDKIWAFTREGIVDDKTLRLFAVGCARRVQHLMKDQRSLDALGVAERYANGEATEDELAVARAAAWYAAFEMAYTGANFAAKEAATAVASRAASQVAYLSATAADWETEYQAQIQIAVGLLTKLK